MAKISLLFSWIICPNSTAQEAAANSRAPGSPARIFQTRIFLQSGHLLALSLCIPWVPKKKLLFLMKECLLSAHGGLIKKFQAFPIRTHAQKKKKSCDYGTFTEHQNPCWRYQSRDSNQCLSTPNDAFIFSEEFSFTIKIITQQQSFLHKEDCLSCW